MAKEITYRQEGEYLIPDIAIPPQPERGLTRYGRMRLNYLKEHKGLLYTQLCMSAELKKHCLEVEDEVEARVDILTAQMKVMYNITEELKASDQMKWIGLMNNIRAQAEEIAFNELIFI